MKLEKKHYWIIAGVAALGIAGIYIYRRNKKLSEQVGSESNEKSGSENFVEDVDYGVEDNSGADIVTSNDSQSVFPLMMGSKNEKVSHVQTYMNTTCSYELKKARLYPVPVTGEWDEHTDKASMTCHILKRNKIDKTTYDRIKRNLKNANLL